MTIITDQRQRRYVFAEHGQPSCPGRCRPPRQRTEQQTPPAAPQLGPPTLAEIITRENLLRVFKRLRATGGQAPGLDRLSYWDVGITEAAAAFGELADLIQQQQYRPQPALCLRVPKSNRRYRELRLRSILDRVVSAAVTERLTNFLDRQFLDCSYGFRPGRCIHQLLAELAHRIIADQRFVVVQDDVRDAFPSVRINDALADYNRHVSDPGLMHLIEVILRGHDPQPDQVGIDQGDPLSPLTLNLRLHNVLDLPSHETTGPDEPLRYRYVDDLPCLCRSVKEGQHCLQQMESLLVPQGFCLKRERNYPVDLRRQNSKASVLGVKMFLANNQVKFELDRKAFQKLGHDLVKVQEEPDPVPTAVDLIHGWLMACGPALESVDVRELLEKVYQVMVRAGYRELGAEMDLVKQVEKAQRHWADVRGQVLSGRSH